MASTSPDAVARSVALEPKVLSQDGRHLRRYKRRWKVERFFSWLFNFRRLVTRYEFHAANFFALIHLACAMMLLGRYEMRSSLEGCSASSHE